MSSTISATALCRALAAVFVLAIGASGCGDDGGKPRCGDGIHQPELGEQCDDGNLDDTDNCRNNCTANLPGQTIVGWSFNKEPTPDFDSDSCIDVRAITVEVTVSGPAQATASEQCSLRQVVFQNLTPGMYTISLRVLDLNGELLTSAPVEVTTNIGPGTKTEVNIPPDVWLRNYTGTFFFRTQWGGQDCANAAPPVTQHRLTLSQGGTPLTQTTENGDPLDGSGPGACQPFSAEFPQSALGLPFGISTLRIEGLDSGGMVQFDETFDTFVGAGISNPELHFDVNSVQPDAGMPDAGLLDAGVDAS